MAAPSGNSIAVGIDGSEYSEQALRWATAEAKMTGRELALVHIWNWPSDVQFLPMGSARNPDARRTGRAALERAATQARKQNVAVTTYLRQGSPAEELSKLAGGAAMLVVGSHGRRPLSKALLGSVSKGCLRHATCPVVVIPYTHEIAESDGATTLLSGRA